MFDLFNRSALPEGPRVSQDVHGGRRDRGIGVTARCLIVPMKSLHGYLTGNIVGLRSAGDRRFTSWASSSISDPFPSLGRLDMGMLATG